MSRNIYLSLGDAIAAGQGASHPTLRFVRHVSEFVKDKSLAERTVEIAQPGLTAKRLFQITTTLRPALWSETALVTICMGSADFASLMKPRRLTLDGNPFPPRATLRKADEFGFHTDQLFKLIHSKGIPHVLVTTLYNPLPSFMPANQFVEGMNGILRDCASYYKFSVIDVDKAFSNNEAFFVDGYRSGGVGDLMIPLRKPFLPNNAGHKLIAHLVTQHLEIIVARQNQRAHKRSVRSSNSVTNKRYGKRAGPENKSAPRNSR